MSTERMTERGTFPWLSWALMSAVSVLLLVGVVSFEGKALDARAWASLVLGLVPLIGLQLLLGLPDQAERAWSWLRSRSRPVVAPAVAVSVFYLLATLLTPGFDPYAATIFVVGTFAALGALYQVGAGRAGLTWVDAAVWMFLWIPFDLRWNYDLWQGAEGFGYNWWAIAISVVAVVGWWGLRGLPNFGYRLVPRVRDVVIALVGLVVFAAIIIPIGLAIDFLTFPPTKPVRISAMVVMFVGLFLTVAIPEELFFRGIFLHGLDQMTDRRWWALFITSVAFGLMHWNNAGDLTTRIAYCALATVAGLFYGWAYRRSGNNILAAALLHTLVDLVWATFLQ